jgi:hypothetical protein
VRELVDARLEGRVREAARPVDDGGLIGIQLRGAPQEVGDKERYFQEPTPGERVKLG